MPLELWNDIAQDFEKSSIILGNGSSLAINSNFSYKSLYENALSEEHINEKLNQVFKHLGTQDFELVLKMIWHTNAINQALKIQDNETTIAYQAVREALIQSVRDNHLHYPEEDPENIQGNYLFKIAKFLKSFQTVISLNYDLLVYWAVYKSNHDNNETWFKDCWNNGIFDENWQRFRTNYNAQGTTLIFYPHGNLILASRWNGQEEKIKQENRLNLRDTIIERWRSGEYIPLFVSEGTSNHKKKAIKRSDYLTIVYDEVLPTIQNRLVIFGWSMSDQDKHILEAINEAKPEKIAISIHLRNEDDEETITQKCQHEREKLRIYPNLCSISDENIHFFDSVSPGFWINNNEV